jgi:hypothetical protein
MSRPAASGILICAFLLQGNVQAGVSSHAMYSAVSNGYELVIRDKRRLMAHDIGALLHTSYIVESHIWVPSLAGTVDARDVHVFEVQTMDGRSSTYNINIASGNVVIQNSRLSVDLQQFLCPKPACIHPYGFNGAYHLQKKHVD